MNRGEVWWIRFQPVSRWGDSVRQGQLLSSAAIDPQNNLNRIQVVPLTSKVDRLYPSEVFVIVAGKEKYKARSRSAHYHQQATPTSA